MSDPHNMRAVLGSGSGQPRLLACTRSSLGVFAVLAALGLAWGDDSRAYSDPYYFDVAHISEEGGSGQRWFTGSPRDRFTCGVCHTAELEPSLDLGDEDDSGADDGTQDSEGRRHARSLLDDTGSEADEAESRTPIDLTIDGLTSDRDIAPDTRYEFEIEVSADVSASAFALEIVDSRGDAVGELSVLSKDAELPDDADPESFAPIVTSDSAGSRQIYVLGQPNAGRARFAWRSPETFDEAFWIFAQVVESDDSGDPSGDRIGALAMELKLANARPSKIATTVAESAGCSTSPTNLRGRAAFAPASWLRASMALFSRRAASPPVSEESKHD